MDNRPEIRIKKDLDLRSFMKHPVHKSTGEYATSEAKGYSKRDERQSIANLRKYVHPEGQACKRTLSCPCGRTSVLPENEEKHAHQSKQRSKLLTGDTLPVPTSGLRRRHTVDKLPHFRQGASSLKVRQNPVSQSGRFSDRTPPNWRRVKTNQLNNTVSQLLWEINSGLGAVKECGLNWSKNVSSAGAAIAENTSDLYSRTGTMTDAKFKELKRSISSWSLSTFKKPKLTGAIFRKPKINVFSNKQKKEEKTATTEEKQNENCNSKNLIPDITIDDGQVPKNDNDDSTKETNGDETVKQDDTGVENVHHIFSDHSSGEIEKLKYIDDDEPSKEVVHPDRHLMPPNSGTKKKPDSDTLVNDSFEQIGYDIASDESRCADNQRSGSETSQSKCHVRSSSEVKYQPQQTTKPKTKDEIVLNSSEPKEKTHKVRPIIKLFKKEKKDSINESNRKPFERQVAERDHVLSRSEKFKKIFGLRRKLSTKPFNDNDSVSCKDADLRMAIAPMALTDSMKDKDTKSLKPQDLLTPKESSHVPLTSKESLTDGDCESVKNSDNLKLNETPTQSDSFLCHIKNAPNVDKEIKPKLTEENSFIDKKNNEAKYDLQNTLNIERDDSKDGINGENKISDKLPNHEYLTVNNKIENEIESKFRKTGLLPVKEFGNSSETNKVTIEVKIDDDNYISKEKVNEQSYVENNLPKLIHTQTTSSNESVIQPEGTSLEKSEMSRATYPGKSYIDADLMSENIMSESIKSASSSHISRNSLVDDIIVEETDSSSETICIEDKNVNHECTSEDVFCDASTSLEISDEEYINKLANRKETTDKLVSTSDTEEHTGKTTDSVKKSEKVSSSENIASIKDQLGGNIRPSTLAVFPPSFTKLPFKTKRSKSKKKSGENDKNIPSDKVCNPEVVLGMDKTINCATKNPPTTNLSVYENTKFDLSEFWFLDKNNESGVFNKEPLYWEIDSEPLSPKACPRKKRERDHQNAFRPAQKAASAMNLPQWIQQRPPMPSPRTKKQSSTQSLQSSHLIFTTNYHHRLDNFIRRTDFQTSNSYLSGQIAGEDFYSGKAASIAYGVTSERTPPPIPLRSKKPSLISLQTNSAEERILVKANPNIKANSQHTGQRQESKKTNKNDFDLNMTKYKLHLSDIVSSIGPINSANGKEEDLLEDVLFSIQSLMGNWKGPSTWFIPAERNVQDQKDSTVTLDQIRCHLQDAFQISDQRMMEILENVQKRKTADLSLFVKVIGAQRLRPKTVRGGSNPYAIVSLTSNTESRRTTLEHETLNPIWNQEFSMKVGNLHSEQLLVQVWHEHHLVDAEQVASIRDIRSLTRLVKETNATLANKEEAHLLGEVRIPLTELKGGSYAHWIPLQKENSKELISKDRGSVLIQIDVGISENINAEERRRSMDSLLARLIYANIKGYPHENKEEEMNIPWSGQLPPEAKAALMQHAIILGIREDAQNISWWTVPSKFPSVDTGWLYRRLKKVQDGITKGVYETTEIDILSDSFASYVQLSIQKLISIQTHFPTSSGVLSRHQLAHMLKILKSLQETAKTKKMLEEKNIPDLLEQAKAAVLQHAKVWWNKLMDEQLAGVAQTEEQIKRIIFITNETTYFLANIAVFYSPVLLTEMNIPFFREAYTLLTQKVNPCVRPLLINIFSKSFDVDSTSDETKNFSLESGSLVWQLYVNLSRIYQLGLELPLDVRENSGIYEYHRWFTRGMLRFIQVASVRSQQMIKKAVELDSFEPIDEYCNFSSSATDITGIFAEIRIWWQKLAWPDPENGGILLAKILEDVCSCGIVYSDLLRSKVDEFFTEHSTTGKPNLISKQICIGLNNIDRVRLELTTLPKQFMVSELSDKIRSSHTGGEYAARSFKENINVLIESSTENMETKVIEFIETVIERMLPTLHDSVIKAFEEESEQHLLINILDPALQILKEKLEDNNFMHVLRRLWDVLVDIFSEVVNKNASRRKASYFSVIHEILERTLKFFSPSIGVGISRDEAKTEAYLVLSSLINTLRLSSENLISKYYMERYEEQNIAGITATADLVVRALFTKVGKLNVEVIMAKNIAFNNDSHSANSKSHVSAIPVDSYVKLQFLPTEWFPHMLEKKTKTLRKSDPAVYEENFEFDLSNLDNGVSEGVMLFTLKDYNIGRSNTFIGESVLPFKNIPCVDSSEVHTVRNTFLKMTVPGFENGYKTMTVLKQRTNDKIATNFHKKVTHRFPDSKSKGMHLFSHSSDEERSTGKSPIVPKRKK